MINPIVPPEYAMEMRYQLDRTMDSATCGHRRDRRGIRREVRRQIRRPVRGVSDGRRGVRLGHLGHRHHDGRGVVDELRESGKKAGLIKLRFMRPFPEKELLMAASKLKALGVFDRSVGFNAYGPVFTETRGALSSLRIPITDHIGRPGREGPDAAGGKRRCIRQGGGERRRGEKVRGVNWHGLRGEKR